MSLTTMMRVLLISWMSLTLMSCGGGGGNSLPPERPAGVVNGNAVDAMIVGGTISVYAFDGSKGKLLGSAVTDQDGFYTLRISAPSQPILIELTEGSYIEEASGRSVNLTDGQVLRAVTHYESGQPVNVMVTPMTNLAAGLAVFKIQQGTSVENAITEASTAISTIYGIDILSTYPRNITDQKNATITKTDEYLYGFWTAAISSWTAWASEQNGVAAHTIWTSIALAQIMYNDIQSDGKLDGQGYVNGSSRLTSLGFGTVLLSTDVYRQAFAQHMLAMVNDTANKTGLVSDQLLTDANSMASSTHALFGSAPPKPLDDTGPDIIAIEPEGQYHNGVFSYSVGVSDFVGVDSVQFDIDGSILDFAVDRDSPAINIDTTIYADGDHLVGVRATDKLGNESYRQLAIKFDNSSPFINVTSKSVTNKAAYTITGTYSDNGIGVGTITAQGREASIQNDGTWSASVTLSNGVNYVPVQVIDKLGNVREVDVLVSLDVVSPNITPAYSLAKYSLGDGTFYEDSLLQADSRALPLYFLTNHLSLSGVPYNTISLAENNYPFIDFTVADPNINGVFTTASDISVSMQYSVSNTILSGWHTIVPAENSLSGANYVIPLATESLSADWYLSDPNDVHLIEVKIEDQAGNIKYYQFRFRADFIVPELVITTSDIALTTIAGTPFVDRSLLYDKDIETTEYTFTNDTDASYLIQLTENATHSVENTVEQAIREHKIRLKTTTEWQAKLFTVGVVVMNTAQRFATCNLYSDWQNVTSISSYDGTNYIPYTVPAPSFGNPQSITSDQLPANPATTPWTTFDLDTTHQYMGTNDGAQIDYKPDFTVSGQTIVAYINSFAYCSGATGSYLQQRSLYNYETLSGYPKNNYSTFTENASFATSNLLVEDQTGNAITPINGWYRIPAGSTITIKKLVKTPVMNIYANTDVGSPSTFSSYTLRKYDKSIAWTIDHGLTITRAHDAGYAKSYAMTTQASTLGNSVTYDLAR